MVTINKNLEEKELEEFPEIKKYFMRIFTVLTKEIREKLKQLDLDKEKKKQIKKELAFLSKDKQFEYLKEFKNKNNNKHNLNN